MTDAELTTTAIAAVEAELGRTLTSTETTQAEQRVKNALVLIRVRLGADLAGVDSDALVLVLGEILLGRIEAATPTGVVEDSESIDDYTFRRRYSQATSRVTILPEWWDLLAPARESGAFSTRPTFEPDEWAEATTL